MVNEKELNNHARYLLAGKRGILAADESNKSATRRFEALNIPSSEETRRQYREMLLTTPGLEQYISGVIFYDETFRQSDSQGKKFTELLQEKGILPGIKVDMGLVDFDNFAGEQITEGLDGLGARFAEYYQMGARFAKWRAAFKISDITPTKAAIHANATMMGRYASLAQAAGIVPIIEPEVLYDGMHTLEQSEKAITETLSVTLEIMRAYRVSLGGLLVKTSMALPGKDTNSPNNARNVADATIRAMKAGIPNAVAGVVFLSGGQTPEQATQNLAAICAIRELPWPVTFSFSRAVQDPAMKLWLGRAENVRAAQDAFLHRLKMNSAARIGEYKPELETQAAI